MLQISGSQLDRMGFKSHPSGGIIIQGSSLESAMSLAGLGLDVAQLIEGETKPVGGRSPLRPTIGSHHSIDLEMENLGCLPLNIQAI